MNLETQVEANTNDISRLNEIVVKLIQLSASHSERLEKILFGLDQAKGEIIELREAQKNTDEKLNALIDAQIRNEEKFQEFRIETQKSLDKMSKAIFEVNEKVDRLEE